MPCRLQDLGPRAEELEINGQSLYGYEPLQQALAAHSGVPPDCVVAASGTSMANFIVMSALVQAGDEVLIEYPVYEPLLATARYLNASIKRFPRGSHPDDYISTRTRLIVVTNLHNPSCTQLDESSLDELGLIANSVGARVLMDEVYLECMYERRYSAFHLCQQFVCTGSLTKAYGLGGLRCGWILAEPDLVRRFWRMKDLLDPGASHPTELLSLVALRNIDRLAIRAKALLDRNRALVADFLSNCRQLEVALPKYGTCVFPRIRSGDGDRLFDLLHNRYDTDVVPGRFFEMVDHFRMGLGGDTDTLSEGLNRLDRALKEL
jgi:aspartate/methionine/tyrosine aminotransferase